MIYDENHPVMTRGDADLLGVSLEHWSMYIHDWATRKGFWESCTWCRGNPHGDLTKCERCSGTGQEPRNFGELVALMHTELSEMLESARVVTADGQPEPGHHCPEFSQLEEEAADLIIRLMDVAAYYKWRLGPAIAAKMLFNEGREHKHGKKF
jgi:NTP pyrophosphatase (non-canonical NTP hydrolase)